MLSEEFRGVDTCYGLGILSFLTMNFSCYFRAAAATESGYMGLRLTYDHRPDDEAEQSRVTEAGGFIARGR